MENYYEKTWGKFVFKKDPSNGCLIGPDGAHYGNERAAMYFGQIGFCGCGDPAAMHKFVIECLQCFDRDKVGFGDGTGVKAIKAIVENNPEAAADFIAYALDKMALTEHGGSVGGSWLTQRGEQFLEIGPATDGDLDD